MEFKMVLLAMAVIFAAAEAGPQGRIVNGSVAYQHQFPYMVALSLRLEDNVKPWCGGAILSKNWVVTAGHCAYQQPQLVLHLGNHNYTAPQFNLTIPASNITLHPGFTRTLENDIALINTSDLPLSEHISPVTLPRGSQVTDDFVGRIVVASGWGLGSADRALLNWTYLRVITQEECGKTHGRKYINDNKLCTSISQGSSTCKGDSGSPLVLDRSRVLVGITSFGQSCTDKSSVGFARITHMLPWIKNVTGLS